MAKKATVATGGRQRKKATRRTATKAVKAVAKGASESAFLETAATGFADVPGDLQIRVDVYVSLLDAITDHFPIKRSEIKDDTVPSANPISADAQGWGVCLATLALYLARNRAIYAFYDHRPAYTSATLDKPVSETVSFLTAAVVEQSKGLGS